MKTKTRWEEGEARVFALFDLLRTLGVRLPSWYTEGDLILMWDFIDTHQPTQFRSYDL